MEKISAEQAMQVYSEVPGVLRALVTERDELKEKIASLQARLNEIEEADRIEKIARSMDQKGLDPMTPFEDKVERIKEAASGGKSLDVIEEAISMTAPNGELGKLGSDPANTGDQLTSYILGGLQ